MPKELSYSNLAIFRGCGFHGGAARWANDYDLFIDLEHDGVSYQVPPSVKERLENPLGGTVLTRAHRGEEAEHRIFACLANYPVIPDAGNFTGNFTGNTAAISRYLVIALS